MLRVGGSSAFHIRLDRFDDVILIRFVALQRVADPISHSCDQGVECIVIFLIDLDQKRRLASANRILKARKDLYFHTFHIDLNEVGVVIFQSQIACCDFNIALSRQHFRGPEISIPQLHPKAHTRLCAQSFSKDGSCRISSRAR